MHGRLITINVIYYNTHNVYRFVLNVSSLELQFFLLFLTYNIKYTPSCDISSIVRMNITLQILYQQ